MMLFINMVSPLCSFNTSGISYIMFSMAATAMQSTTVIVSERKNLVYISSKICVHTFFRK